MSGSVSNAYRWEGNIQNFSRVRGKHAELPKCPASLEAGNSPAAQRTLTTSVSPEDNNISRQNHQFYSFPPSLCARSDASHMNRRAQHISTWCMANLSRKPVIAP